MKKALLTLLSSCLLVACGAQIEVKKVYWDDSHTLKDQTRYVNGVATGPHFNYYPSGKLKVSSIYLNNELDGPYFAYFKNGSIYKKETYNNGVLQGDASTYCVGGELKELLQFTNGKRDGISEVYYKCSGQIRESASYILGEIQNLQVYYKNGKPKNQQQYAGGKLEGKTIIFHRNGNTKSERQYSAGKYQGTNIEYYWDGTLKEKAEYHLGKRHGSVRNFYESGELRMDTPYVNGQKNGIRKKYSESGKPMLLICSTIRRDKPCNDAEQFAQKAKSLGMRVELLKVAMSHRDINAELGADGVYTER